MILRDSANLTLLSSDISTYSQDHDVSVTMMSTPSCLQAKLTMNTSKWGTYCPDSNRSTINPTFAPDLKLVLAADSTTTGNSTFTVYSKIVDTVAGNTDTSGIQLEGSGVAEASSTITPQHFPFIYRLEVQGQRSTNDAEKSGISVLYAY
jgi:hypothetical protein